MDDMKDSLRVREAPYITAPYVVVGYIVPTLGDAFANTLNTALRVIDTNVDELRGKHLFKRGFVVRQTSSCRIVWSQSQSAPGVEDSRRIFELLPGLPVSPPAPAASDPASRL